MFCIHSAVNFVQEGRRLLDLQHCEIASSLQRNTVSRNRAELYFDCSSFYVISVSHKTCDGYNLAPKEVRAQLGGDKNLSKSLHSERAGSLLDPVMLLRLF